MENVKNQADEKNNSSAKPQEAQAQRPKTPKDIEMENRAKKMRVTYVDISMLTLDPKISSIIPEDLAKRDKLICIDKNENRITVAMADPMDVFAIDDVKMRTGLEITVVLSAIEDIDRTIVQIYGEDTSWKSKLEEDFGDVKLDISTGDENVDADVVIDQPVIIAVNKIIAQALERKASDIHIEPFEGELLVRYRIDGILHEVMKFPKSVAPALISRVKIMSNLDIAEKRIPQDGRIHLIIKKSDIDFRVSTLPSLYGESVVMRILDRKNMQVDLVKLGFAEKDLTAFQKLVSRPNGIVLVTGPTGSGKTTTLYSCLNFINNPDTKILTIEDPIEYNLKGVVQVQTHARVGLTFAAGLRSFLRQDPDIIMVGEIRDKETAAIAVESALTGHLVLSTLHTNDSVGAVTRLIDMGIEPFLLASTLNGVLAQRLVRKVCQNCKKDFPRYPELMEKFIEYGIPEKEVTLLKGEGCNVCNNTGYKGRLGIYELFRATDTVKDMIIKRITSNALMDQAKKDGLTSLFEDGLKKVASGQTTYEELCRATMD